MEERANNSVSQAFEAAVKELGIKQMLQELVWALEEKGVRGEEWVNVYGEFEELEKELQQTIFRSVKRVDVKFVQTLDDNWNDAKALSENHFWNFAENPGVVDLFLEMGKSSEDCDPWCFAMLARFVAMRPGDKTRLSRLVEHAEADSNAREWALIILGGAAHNERAQLKVLQQVATLNMQQKVLGSILRLWEGKNIYPLKISEKVIEVLWEELRKKTDYYSLISHWKWFITQAAMTEELRQSVVNTLTVDDLWTKIDYAVEEHRTGASIPPWCVLAMGRIVEKQPTHLGTVSEDFFLQYPARDWLKQVFSQLDRALQARFLAAAPQPMRAAVMGRIWGKGVGR